MATGTAPNYPDLDQDESFFVYIHGIDLARRSRDVVRAWTELQDAVRTGDDDLAWYHVASLLSAAGAISRTLWPSRSGPSPNRARRGPGTIAHLPSWLESLLDTLRGRMETSRKGAPWYRTRGRTLRTRFHVKDTSAFSDRSLRNAFEHFDEKLDDFLRDGNAIVIDSNVGPKAAIPALPVLRHLDPTTWVVSFLDQSLNLEQLAKAAAGLPQKMRGVSFMLDAELDRYI